MESKERLQNQGEATSNWAVGTTPGSSHRGGPVKSETLNPSRVQVCGGNSMVAILGLVP